MGEETGEPKKRKLPKDLLVSAWRVSTLALLVANLWLKDNFVSKLEYQKDRETYRADKEKTDLTLNSIDKILTKMEERDKVNDRQDTLLRDHEERIRLLEARKR